jgi:hypothetical protein
MALVPGKRMGAPPRTQVGQFAALQREVNRVVSMTWWDVGRDFC